MIKFTAVLKYDNSTGKYNLTPTPAPGCQLPSAAELAALLREVAGMIERNHTPGLH